MADKFHLNPLARLIGYDTNELKLLQTYAAMSTWIKIQLDGLPMNKGPLLKVAKTLLKIKELDP